MPLMNTESDPIGAAVSEFFEGLAINYIDVYSKLGGKEIIDPRYLFRTYSEMPILEHIALENCKGKILDIGAGAGCHSIFLQNQGNDVTALEKSLLCCRVMTEMGIEKVVNADIYTHTESKYDTLLLLMNGIGLVGELKKLASFFNHCQTLLNPGGQIIFDSSDLDHLFLGARKPIGHYYGEVVYRMKYKDIKGKKFKWLFVDKQSCIDIASNCGFNCIELFEDESGQFLLKLQLDK